MNKWCVDVFLKAKYGKITCCYIGEEDNSNDVLASILPNDYPVRFITLLHAFRKRQVIIAVDEIAYLEIYPDKRITKEKKDG